MKEGRKIQLWRPFFFSPGHNLLSKLSLYLELIKTFVYFLYYSIFFFQGTRDTSTDPLEQGGSRSLPS